MERVRVVEERTAFDTSPNEFRKSTLHLLLFSNSFVWSAFALRTRPFAEYESEQRAIISKLDTARELLPSVQVQWKFGSRFLRYVSCTYDCLLVFHSFICVKVCSELDVDGLRGDLVTTRASRAAAAYRFVLKHMISQFLEFRRLNKYISCTPGVPTKSPMKTSTRWLHCVFVTVCERILWRLLTKARKCLRFSQVCSDMILRSEQELLISP